MNYIKRQKKLIALLEDRTLDALLVRKKQNISYFTGVRGDDAVVFISHKGTFIVTDPRYREEYARAAENSKVIICGDGGIYRRIEDIARTTRSRRIGFESDNFSYSEYVGLKSRLKNTKFVPATGMAESLRIIKDKNEIKLIRKACKDGCGLMNHALKTVRPGITERFLRDNLYAYIRKRGTAAADFDIIVASGKNASMPHAAVSDKKIKRGEPVIIDLGTMNYGYNSDLTRTVFLGRIERKYLEIYKVVSAAQKKAIEHIKAGVEARHIDNISRQYISNKGLGKYFIHSIGHGIGLEVHEKPRISKNSRTLLQKGMTFTVEPGVYIPGWGGVRIEDVVLVCDRGCEILTQGAQKPLCRQMSIR